MMLIRKGLALGMMVAVTGLVVFGHTALSQGSPQIFWGRSVANKQEQQQPRVEVVFCLDTTGSMNGLIDGAKQKIWSMCNKIAGGQPRPQVKVGLVAYRDRGDEYVTKTFDLSEDLDEVHSHLLRFEAAGGGDEPESVNEALFVALNNISWSQESNVLRIIYLVGDAPPHMDYPNDITYKTTCKRACDKGIIINTIQCGNIQATTPFWREIAEKSQGRFVQIAQDGGVITVCTPYDQRLAAINGQLAQSSVCYGDAPTQAQAAAKAQIAAMPMAVPSAPTITSGSGTYTLTAPLGNPPAPECVTAAADRAGYNAKVGQVGAWDLIDNIKAGNVKLETLKTEELPEPMQKMTLAERKAHLAKVEGERSKLQAEALDLDRKRSDYLNAEMNKNGAQAGFDAQVMEMLREQAKSVNIRY
ncbi:MAG TPA: vWA domain-containing protein [Gemmataceae bacterium]|nr:vWA domain-containing protein [Gemmataceae bacterium]